MNKAKKLKAELDNLYNVKRMLTNRLALNESNGKVEVEVQTALDKINTEISDLTNVVA